MDRMTDEQFIKELEKRADAFFNECLIDYLKKIRKDILAERDFAYADFERYKVEWLGQDWEEAGDSLPQDDYRYGMERCIEIIDKVILELKGVK